MASDAERVDELVEQWENGNRSHVADELLDSPSYFAVDVCAHLPGSDDQMALMQIMRGRASMRRARR